MDSSERRHRRSFRKQFKAETVVWRQTLATYQAHMVPASSSNLRLGLS